MELEIDEMLVDVIQNATQKALGKLFEEHIEKFYYCSLITTGEGLCPIISAWSYEALERVANEEDDVEERLGIVINAEFMPPDFTNTERALRLNPREALKEWLEEIAE